MTAGDDLHRRLRAAQEAGEEQLLVLLAELDPGELREAHRLLHPVPPEARDLADDDGGAGARWGRS